MSDRARAILGDARRVVLKVGSRSLLADGGRYGALAAQIATQRAQGRDVVLVSSGAVAEGRKRLGMTQRSLNCDN